MHGLELVDQLYEAFVDTLHPSLATYARRLPCILHLTPVAEATWSRVFEHEVTLAAPGLFADAMPNASPGDVRNAVAAQAFAVIEAFGTDRIEDGQVPVTPELMAVLGALRRASARAISRVCPGVTEPSIDFGAAHSRTLAAIAAERSILSRRGAVSFNTYEAASLGKQSIGFPASLGLALAAGWDARRRMVMQRTLASIWVGLQMADDVVDWEDDLSRGGAWAYSLALGWRQRSDSSPAISGRSSPREVVWSTRILGRMLERARWHFRAVEARARALGADRLAAWADERERSTHSMARGEARSPGYVARLHALLPWAAEVLG